jgi:GxxExxY protein
MTQKVDIIKIANNIFDILGRGLSENIYQNTLCSMLRDINLSYSEEVVIPIKYFNYNVGTIRADIVINELDTIIELKAVETSIKENHCSQLIAYMSRLNINKGYIINFNQNPNKDLEYIFIEFKDNSYYAKINNKTFIFDKNSKII